MTKIKEGRGLDVGTVLVMVLGEGDVLLVLFNSGCQRWSCLIPGWLGRWEYGDNVDHGMEK